MVRRRARFEARRHPSPRPDPRSLKTAQWKKSDVGGRGYAGMRSLSIMLLCRELYRNLVVEGNFRWFLMRSRPTSIGRRRGENLVECLFRCTRVGNDYCDEEKTISDGKFHRAGD